MKKRVNYLGIIFLLIAAVMILTVLGVFQQLEIAKAMASWFSPRVMVTPLPPTDVPSGYQPNPRATPTPDMSKITPLPTVFYIQNDLSPELGLDNKYRILVRHADGSMEVYYVGPPPADDELHTKQRQLPPEILDRVSLKPDDIVIDWFPPVPMLMQPTLAPEARIPTFDSNPTFTPEIIPPTLATSYP